MNTIVLIGQGLIGLVYVIHAGVFVFGGAFFNLVISLVSTMFARMPAKPAIYVFILLLAY